MSGFDALGEGERRMRRGWSPGTLTAWTARKGRAGEGGTRILVSIRKKEKEELVVDAAEKPNTVSPEKTFGHGPQSGIGDYRESSWVVYSDER